MDAAQAAGSHAVQYIPCGPCRQVISEFGPDAEVVCVCEGEEEIRASMLELLPYQFASKHLG